MFYKIFYAIIMFSIQCFIIFYVIISCFFMEERNFIMESVENLADMQGDLRGIFFDIDDTFTLHGKIYACAFESIWTAYKQGLRVIPITGRPAGWADHMARMWPITSIVGENGAFYFYMNQGKMCRKYIQSEEERKQSWLLLEQIRERVLQEVPSAKVSADQAYRESDLAIDFCEDVPALGKEDVDKIVSIFQEFGAQAKISSIHVNGWFGEFNKLSTCLQMVHELWGETEEEVRKHYVFCGDSPNDEPMFSFFDYSVGVANVMNYVDRMKFLPRYITKSQGSEGFAEMMSILLSNRKEEENVS